MGVDLLSDYGDVSFNWACWRALLNIALEFGWTPTGTVPPPNFDLEWGGSYYTNDFQVVTESDARALAGALLKAVDRVRTNQPLTVRQAAAVDGVGLEAMVKLARYACIGDFAIG